MTEVVILGCGPAGLMSAHAATEAGANVVIYSAKQKSALYGAQYLHRPIPGVTNRENNITVDYQMRGSAEHYRRKVYGPLWDGTVSPEDLEAQHMAWDIRETYDVLWEMFEDRVIDVQVDPAGLTQLYASNPKALVINTVPLNKLCPRGHSFGYTEVVAAGDAPQLGIDVGMLYHCPPDTVVCNGEDSPSWYRLSRIFDHTTVEWPANTQPPIGTASQVIKPTQHNCDCWPDMLKVGRYGSWSKGVLSHTAYFETQRRLEYGSAAEAARYNDPSVPTLF